MSITYIPNIPLASNNPSNDQPNMQINTNAVTNWVQVDHVGFNAANGGQHKQVTFPAENAPLGAPSGTSSVLYSVAGVADTGHPVMQYQNANLTFPVSLIRAYASFAGATGTISALQSIGVASVSRTSAANYTVTLNANVVTGTSYGVFASTEGSVASVVAINILSATSFTLVTGIADPTNVYFIVTQL